jgi:hypothetical protein
VTFDPSGVSARDRGEERPSGGYALKGFEVVVAVAFGDGAGTLARAT